MMTLLELEVIRLQEMLLKMKKLLEALLEVVLLIKKAQKALKVVKEKVTMTALIMT